jgi:hypothetical protein
VARTSFIWMDVVMYANQVASVIPTMTIQQNYALDTRGKQRQVLFDGVQDCAQLFHLPLRVPDAMFDGIDDDVDDDVPIGIGTPATAANPVIGPEQPEWTANNFDKNEELKDLGITFVNGVPVVPDQDDESDTPHVVDETPEEVEEEENNDGNVYARELPVSCMDGYPFRQPALDMVFREMFENLQMRCSDMRAPADPTYVEWKLLIKRTIHARLLA